MKVPYCLFSDNMALTTERAKMKDRHQRTVAYGGRYWVYKYKDTPTYTETQTAVQTPTHPPIHI